MGCLMAGILFGDVDEEVELSTAFAALGARIAGWDAWIDEDQVRELLIAAGQLEQAAHDTLAPNPGPVPEVVSRLHEITCLLAEIFVAVSSVEERAPAALVR